MSNISFKWLKNFAKEFNWNIKVENDAIKSTFSLIDSSNQEIKRFCFLNSPTDSNHENYQIILNWIYDNTATIQRTRKIARFTSGGEFVICTKSNFSEIKVGEKYIFNQALELVGLDSEEFGF